MKWQEKKYKMEKRWEKKKSGRQTRSLIGFRTLNFDPRTFLVKWISFSFSFVSPLVSLSVSLSDCTEFAFSIELFSVSVILSSVFTDFEIIVKSGSATTSIFLLLLKISSLLLSTPLFISSSNTLFSSPLSRPPFISNSFSDSNSFSFSNSLVYDIIPPANLLTFENPNTCSRYALILTHRIPPSKIELNCVIKDYVKRISYAWCLN